MRTPLLDMLANYIILIKLNACLFKNYRCCRVANNNMQKKGGQNDGHPFS